MLVFLHRGYLGARISTEPFKVPMDLTIEVGGAIPIAVLLACITAEPYVTSPANAAAQLVRRQRAAAHAAVVRGESSRQAGSGSERSNEFFHLRCWFHDFGRPTQRAVENGTRFAICIAGVEAGFTDGR